MFGLWSNIWVRVRSGLPGRVAGGAGGVHPCIMAPMESSPIMCGNLWCSTAAQVWGRVGGWEAEGASPGFHPPSAPPSPLVPWQGIPVV